MSIPRASPAPSPAPSRRARGPKPQSRPARLFTTNSISSSRPRLDSLTPGPTAPPRPPSHTCPNPACMERDNVVQEDDGSWICHHCGTIASEHSRIVSDIQFAETASGAPAVQGQYIGADQTHARSAAVGRRSGYAAAGGDGPNSKQLTELSARREILAIMQNLGQKGVVVAQSFIDPALGLFKLALGHNFVQGRSISTVAAVALYLQCRRSKETNEVMLIDIAECINVNVFVLGKMYTKLIQKLYGTTNQNATLTDKIETINPENLIRRFAKGLDFPKRDDRNQIVRDAIRLVQRMDRDWMATGRRPAGICGAALILAARMNNFRRTVREVVLVVKVTEITINKRLEEFSYTDSSNLTVEQFRGITLEKDCDPPAFYRARQEKTPKRRKKRKGVPETAAEIEGGEQEEEEDEDDDDDDDDVEEVAAQPARKRARIDSDGFAIPEIPIDPALRRSTPRSINPAAANAEELPELSALVRGSTGESPIDEALTLAVNTAISEMISEEQPSRLPAGSSELEDSDSTPKDVDASSSEPHPGEQPRRRRGRPKGAKNWQPPPESAAELALEAEIEAEIEGELRKVSESGLMEPFRTHVKSSQPASSSKGAVPQSDQGGPAHSSAPIPSSNFDPSSEQETPPASSLDPSPVTTARAEFPTTEPSETSTVVPPGAISTEPNFYNPPGVEDTTLIYLDDDPEISSCILSEEERLIKERIWVTENADWLRKDHVKKIKAELQAAADREAGIDPDDAGQGRGKGRSRKKKRGRLGDVSYLDKGGQSRNDAGGGEEGNEGGTARSAREATLKMIAHRGYSRRVNYDVFKSLFPEEEEAARGRSSRSSTSTTTAAEKRRDSGARATASGSGSPASTPAVEKDAAAGTEETTTTGASPSPTTSAPVSVVSTTGPAAPSTAKPQPKPRPHTRKAVSAVAIPVAEPGKPPPEPPSGPSRPTNPPPTTSLPPSDAAKRFGRAPGGQKGWQEPGARREARAAAGPVMAKEWDKETEGDEEVLDEAEEEERAWRARTAPKDAPALASASAAEGVTKGTAVRLGTPDSRSQSLVRQLPTPDVTQAEALRQEPAHIGSPRIPATAISTGEEEILGSIDDSPLTSLRSSIIGADDDADEDDGDDEGDAADYVEDDAADYVEVDEDDDVEAAFAGRFVRRRDSFDDEDEDDDMEDV